MAWPKRTGVRYFPHDVDAVNDLKIAALRATYGNDGYAFFFILLEKIYQTKTFELDLSSEVIKQALAEEIKVANDRFDEILIMALELGLFDHSVYEIRSVVTSDAIKTRSFEATKWLSNWEDEAFAEGNDDDQKMINYDQKMINDTDDHNLIMIQREEKKRKEAKEKKRREKSISSLAFESTSTSTKIFNKDLDLKLYTDDFEQFWTLYPRKIVKKRAWACWKAQLKKGVAAEDMILAAKNYAAECRRKRTEQEFIQHPSTFIGPKDPFVDYLKKPEEVKIEWTHGKEIARLEKQLSEHSLVKPSVTPDGANSLEPNP